MLDATEQVTEEKIIPPEIPDNVARSIQELSGEKK